MPFNKNVALALLALLVVPAATYGIYELALHTRFSPTPPPATYPEPSDTRESRAQDLDYFRHFLALDMSYTPATRARALEIIETLETDTSHMSDAAFQLAITRAVAAADNGHTNIWIGRFSRAHGRLPIRFYWFADGLFVVAAKPPYEHLLGKKLESVSGVKTASVMQRLKVFVGGPWSGYRAYRGPAFLELPSALHAVGISDSETSASLRFAGEDSDVEIERVTLEAEEPLWWPSSYLAPNEPLPGWVTLEPPLPSFLQSSEQLFRSEYLEAYELLYVQFRANRGEGLDDFLHRVRELLTQKTPATLVIDQRNNGGGDYTLTESLMSDLPDLVSPNSHVYVITGGATFSAGINSVAFAKASLGDRMTIVGERIGDRERAYGETNEFELPNANLGMTFNTGLHDVGAGCPPFPECYWRNYFNDVAVGNLDPHVPIEYRFEHFVQGIDPVMEYLLKQAR